MNRLSLSACSPWVWLTAVVLLLPATPVLAQEGKRQPADPLKGTDTTQLQSWSTGTAAPGDNDTDLLKRAADWYVNRITWSEYQKREQEGTSSGGLNVARLVQEAFEKIPIPTPGKPPLNDNQQQYLRAFTRQLVPDLRAVLQNPEWIVRVNAARILARLGQAGQQGAGNLMAEVVRDPKQNEAVKLWALRGLKYLFASGRPKPQQETRWIETLVDYVTQTRKVPAKALPERVAAINYVRREAIRALGQTRLPSAGKAQTALVLLRIAAGRGVTPPPLFAERLEAAIGVAQLQHKFDENYQPDYAANVLGLFLADFAGEYATDQANPVTVGSSDTDKDDGGGKSTTYLRYAWKYEAHRLAEALDAFKDDAGDDAYVADVVAKAKGVLRQVQSYSPDVNRTDMVTWMTRHPTPAAVTSVYKGDSKSTVQPSESTEE